MIFQGKLVSAISDIVVEVDFKSTQWKGETDPEYAARYERWAEDAGSGVVAKTFGVDNTTKWGGKLKGPSDLKPGTAVTVECDVNHQGLASRVTGG